MLNQLASIKLLASQKWKPKKLVFLFSLWDQFNQIMVFHFFSDNWEFHSKSDGSRVISRSRQKKIFKGKVFRAGTKKKKVISKEHPLREKCTELHLSTRLRWKTHTFSPGVISLRIQSKCEEIQTRNKSVFWTLLMQLPPLVAWKGISVRKKLRWMLLPWRLFVTIYKAFLRSYTDNGNLIYVWPIW